MKWIGMFLGIIIALAAAATGVLFTQQGNDLLRPMIEAEAAKALKLPVSVERFTLRFGRFALNLQLTDGNRITAEGTFSVMEQRIDAAYRVTLDDLPALQALTQQPLQGQLHTNGTVKGPLEAFTVLGTTDVAESNSTYKLFVEQFNPAALHANVNGAKIAALLHMVSKPSFAEGELHAAVQMAPLDPALAEGDLVLKVLGARINRQMMQDEFNVTLPHTTFDIHSEARVTPAKTHYTLAFNSNLADVTSEGDVVPAPFAAELVYDVRVKELGLFKPLTDSDARGPFATKGSVSGDEKQLTIKGSSDLAGSDTTYETALTEYQPRSVKLLIRNARLEKLLYMAGQPETARGDLYANVTLTSLDPDALQGKVDAEISKAELDRTLVKKLYDVDLPDTGLTSRLSATLDKETVTYRFRFDSQLAAVYSKGTVIPASTGLDLDYKLNFKELKLLQPLTKQALQGPLTLEGTVKGDKGSMTVKGNSDIAQSKTAFDARLKGFKPEKVVVTIDGARVEKLLHMVSQPPMAAGNLSADVNLVSLDPDALKGTVKATLGQAYLDRDVMRSRYQLELPKTIISSELDAHLDKETVDYVFKLDSSVVAVHSKGRAVPKTVGLDLSYGLNVKELRVLSGLTGQPFNGPLSLDGEVKGDRALMKLKGSTDLAGSTTRFSATLQELAPRSAQLNISGLKLDRLLHFANQPHYADGVLDVTATLNDLREGRLDGTVKTRLNNGQADAATVAKAFEWPLFKGTAFALEADTTLDRDLIVTEATFTSDLLEYTTRNTRYDLGKQRLDSDFRAHVPDLARLYFLTEQPLRGDATFTGDLVKDQVIDLKAKSDILGGRINATLHDKDFHAELKGLKTLSILYMLTYPESFDATLNGTLDYNLASRQGLLASRLFEGRFTRNTMFDQLRNYTPVDLYVERFNGTLDSDIRDKTIIGQLDLRSNVSSIRSENGVIDGGNKRIDAKVDINANNNPLSVTLKGNIDSPGIKIDASEIVKKEASKQIRRLLNDYFK